MLNCFSSFPSRTATPRMDADLEMIVIRESVTDSDAMTGPLSPGTVIPWYEAPTHGPRATRLRVP